MADMDSRMGGWTSSAFQNNAKLAKGLYIHISILWFLLCTIHKFLCAYKYLVINLTESGILSTTVDAAFKFDAPSPQVCKYSVQKMYIFLKLQNISHGFTCKVCHENPTSVFIVRT